MLIRFSTILMVVFSIISCSSPSDSTVENEFPSFQLNESIVQNPEEVLKDVEFIPLKFPEGTPVQFFGFDPHISFAEDKIFLNTDPYMKPTIHAFDYQGNHLETIARQGGGPNEYGSISKMGVTKEGQLAMVSQNALLEFDEKMDIKNRLSLTSDGSYYAPISLHPWDENHWFFALRGPAPDEEGYFQTFALFNKDSLSYEFLPLKTFPASGSGESGAIAPYKSGYLLNFGLSDTIFYYSEGKIRPLASINSGDRSLPMEKRTQTEDKMDEELEQMIATQPYDVNMGSIAVAGETIGTHVFGIKPMPLDLAAIQEMDEAPDDFPMYEVYINPEKRAIKASKIVPGLSGFAFSDGEYFYRLLYTEVWNRLLENKQLGEKHTQSLQAASDELFDEEDPIIIRYKIKW